jgi:hypothetical protein
VHSLHRARAVNEWSSAILLYNFETPKRVSVKFCIEVLHQKVLSDLVKSYNFVFENSLT